MTLTAAVVAAHPDDEVLGCGGTIASMAKDGWAVHVLLLADGEGARGNSDSAVPKNLVAARRKAADVAGGIMGCASMTTLALPDNRLDQLEMLDVVKIIEEFVKRHRPQTVFTHHSGDVNVDHRMVHEAVVAACRPQPGHPVRDLLFFEIPSSTEWRPAGSLHPFVPNWYVDISSTLRIKMRALKAYHSEMRKFPHPRSIRAARALAEWRGATVGMTAAEAFVLGRRILTKEEK